ncbi:hypothetical protein CXG81DRAFT_19398 [Caulochytrium protostelioides]|uniref:Uncharacterized protein n=1 Tax=Caulochytrium protostelioides TaxID=1555241 RepID=A0A4V1IUI4_9FUNG|nr:hypothetical protein CXG81DRAFT_19398 [Caulochytrium protostelioides]|eukprot:RKP00669.1 hypothetical protein CXG81DRAFT_19398 [Caulochytrium protostelioides]
MSQYNPFDPRVFNHYHPEAGYGHKSRPGPTMQMSAEPRPRPAISGLSSSAADPAGVENSATESEGRDQWGQLELPTRSTESSARPTGFDPGLELPRAPGSHDISVWLAKLTPNAFVDIDKVFYLNPSLQEVAPYDFPARFQEWSKMPTIITVTLFRDIIASLIEVPESLKMGRSAHAISGLTDAYRMWQIASFATWLSRHTGFFMHLASTDLPKKSYWTGMSKSWTPLLYYAVSVPAIARVVVLCNHMLEVQQLDLARSAVFRLREMAIKKQGSTKVASPRIKNIIEDLTANALPADPAQTPHTDFDQVIKSLAAYERSQHPELEDSKAEVARFSGDSWLDFIWNTMRSIIKKPLTAEAEITSVLLESALHPKFVKESNSDILLELANDPDGLLADYFFQLHSSLTNLIVGPLEVLRQRFGQTRHAIEQYEKFCQDQTSLRQNVDADIMRAA